MRSRLPLALAALAAATAATLAVAQSQKSGDAYVHAPTAQPYVAEPVASVAAGASAEGLTGIVEALNADASLRGSKLTVVQDGDVTYLTGVTVTRDQMKRALEVAGQSGGKVANAITSEQLEIVTHPVVAPVAEADTAAPEAVAATDAEAIQPATPGEPAILPATSAPRT